MLESLRTGTTRRRPLQMSERRSPDRHEQFCFSKKYSRPLIPNFRAMHLNSLKEIPTNFSISNAMDVFFYTFSCNVALQSTFCELSGLHPSGISGPTHLNSLETAREIPRHLRSTRVLARNPFGQHALT